MISREYVNFQDKLYWVYRKFREKDIKEGHIQDVKDAFFCDIVVKNKSANNEEILYFLREIQDAVIEDD